MADNAFLAGQRPWLQRLGNLRNVVRQEMVTRQLAGHLPRGPLRVLDVGAGQGTQALRLARLGHSVTAAEPDGRMRAAFEQAAAGLTSAQRNHVTLLATDLAGLASVTQPTAYDVVMCHGVLMYLPESRPAVAGLARRVAPGGVVSIVARNGDAMAWRPAARHDWRAALAMLEETRSAAAEGRNARYRNEIGVDARADTRTSLSADCEAAGLEVTAWYGIRVASDDVPVDEPAPRATTSPPSSTSRSGWARPTPTAPWAPSCTSSPAAGDDAPVVSCLARRMDAVDRAFEAVPRKGFLPRLARSRAGHDGPILIGHGQTNSQPRTVADMLRLLDVRPGQRVLDVGSGSGWTTALLAHLTGPEGTVLGVELEADLARWGAQNVAALGVPWARVREALPGVLGDPYDAPWDRILVSAEADSLPPSLVDQLADPGRLVIPVAGTMTLVVRADGTTSTTHHGRYRFVPLRQPRADR